MKIKIIIYSSLIFTINFLTLNLNAQVVNIDSSLLHQTFNLAGKRSPQIQYYKMESKFINYDLSGKRAGFDIYKLYLKCIPSALNDNTGDKYICTKFSISKNDTVEVSIPALKNWSYIYKISPKGMDEKGQVLGIDHAKFENLVDNEGNKIPPGNSYMIYNTFIDFHSFCNVFAQKTSRGKGIQNLTKIGQKIIHAASNSKPPVNLGSNVSKGSYFKNGEITLMLKGVSLVDNAVCALVGFDSGESSFYMKMNPSPNIKIETKGTSHYKGDIYIDLNTIWVGKVMMDEFVLSETKLLFPPDKINSVTERNTIINNVSKDEFENY